MHITLQQAACGIACPPSRASSTRAVVHQRKAVRVPCRGRMPLPLCGYGHAWKKGGARGATVARSFSCAPPPNPHPILKIHAGCSHTVQVWLSPSLEKQMSPMQLHRTYGQCHADVLDLAWSPDGQFVAAASKDMTLRVFSLHPIQAGNKANVWRRYMCICMHACRHARAHQGRGAAGVLSLQPIERELVASRVVRRHEPC